MRLFGGYGSIVISIIFGFFIFLNEDRPAIAFFGFVFGSGILLRYALTLMSGYQITTNIRKKENCLESD
jgi:predicted RND superfamily exporter protein